MRDLRSWLQQVKEMGELQIIRAEMDWNEETSALNYMVGQREGSPALLFENMNGTPPGFRSTQESSTRLTTTSSLWTATTTASAKTCRGSTV